MTDRAGSLEADRDSVAAMAKAPPKKLRWDRLLIALVVLGGGAAAAIYYVTQ